MEVCWSLTQCTKGECKEYTLDRSLHHSLSGSHQTRVSNRPICCWKEIMKWVKLRSPALNPGPSCCEATVLTTKRPCRVQGGHGHTASQIFDQWHCAIGSTNATMLCSATIDWCELDHHMIQVLVHGSQLTINRRNTVMIAPLKYCFLVNGKPTRQTRLKSDRLSIFLCDSRITLDMCQR